MATSTNVLKSFAGLLRSRMQTVLELTEIYRGEAIRRREKIVELIKEKAEQASRSEFAGKMRVAKGFYTLEMAPPVKTGELKKLAEDMALVKEFLATGCFKHLTVKQAWLLFLVGIEVYLWFYLGETIGKFHIVGYKV